MQIGNLIFPGHNKEAECLTVFFCMLAVMNIMSIYHPTQVTASFFGSPLKALMDDDVVENQIKCAVEPGDSRDIVKE